MYKKNMTTLASLSERNVSRSHEAAKIEREKARRRLERIAKRRRTNAQTKEELKVQTETVQRAVPKKYTRPGVTMVPGFRASLLEHINRVGVTETAEDIENLEPSRKGSKSARDAIRVLIQEPEHRWSERSIRMWKRILACWSRGMRMHQLRSEGVDLTANGEVITVIGEAVRNEQPVPSMIDKPDPDPESPNPEQKALMSYSLNADGLPVMVMDGVTIRVAGTPERPLFCAADVCRALDIANSRSACESLAQDELELVSVQSTSGSKQATFVTEPGLYKLIQKSRKPRANDFDRWVRHDVLPSIRKTGSYSTDAANGTRSIATTDKVLMVEVMTEAFAQVVTRVIPMIQQAQQPGIKRQEFDVNGFEVPSGELPKTNKRAGINGLIESYVAANPDVSREECHSLLHKRFQSAYGIRPPKDCPNKLDWYEKNGHIDALYALAYAMFARRNGG